MLRGVDFTQRLGVSVWIAGGERVRRVAIRRRVATRSRHRRYHSRNPDGAARRAQGDPAARLRPLLTRDRAGDASQKACRIARRWHSHYVQIAVTELAL